MDMRYDQAAGAELMRRAGAIETGTGEREAALVPERAAARIEYQAERATPAKGGQGMGL